MNNIADYVEIKNVDNTKISSNANSDEQQAN